MTQVINHDLGYKIVHNPGYLWVVVHKEKGSRFGHFGGFVLDFTMFIY